MSIRERPSKRPAAARGLPFLGNLLDFARQPIEFVTRLQRDHGDVAAFSLLGTPSVLISHPEDIQQVLLETGKRYSNGKQGAGYALDTILGKGLVTSEGDLWRRQRKLMAPAFHHQSIKQYADLIVAYTQDMADTWCDGAVRDVHQDMMTLTQRIIMKALFDVDVLENAGEASAAFDAMMHALGAEMSGPEAILPPFVPTRSRGEMTKAVTYINGLVTDIIEKRQAEGNSRRHDLLAMLMEARDDEGQPMSTAQLLDEIRTLYLAGHETAATTLSWAWMLLTRHPDAYARLEAEIDRVLDGCAPTAERVPELAYSEAVIKETLRCYPVAWITRRVALEDVEIRGYAVGKGTSVFLSPWIVHHDPRWYADPDAFLPERWLKDKPELPPRDAYLPFGGGPRVCIGNGFAMMEAVLILATLLQRYHIALVPGQAVAIEMAGTLRPKAGLRATLTARAR